MSKSKAEGALEFWKDTKEFLDACSYSLIAITLGLRKGEAGRKNALRPGNTYEAEIEWWFELALVFHPVYKEAEGPAKAALVAWLIGAVKEWLKTIRK